MSVWILTPRRILWDVVCIAEVIVSVVVHLSYGLSVFGSAVWIDVMSTLSASRPQSRRHAHARVHPIVDENGENSKFVADDDDDDDDERATTRAVKQQHVEGFGAHVLEGHHEKPPIVLLHGIFGFGKEKLGSLSYWGGAEQRYDRILVPDLGALTSIHDRACLLFYYLKGGTVDFGLKRSQQFGHSRFGRTYEQGHYAEWDENHPIHLVGHSSGVQVARHLQHMLAEKAFPGHKTTSADWVLSVTSLSGAMNGTTRVFLDGICPEDGQTMKTISLLQFLRIGVLFYEWLDIPALKKYYAFGFDHYNLSWHKAGMSGLRDTMLGRSGPFAARNWVIPDLSIQHAVEVNKKLQTYPNTYYFSYATKHTRKVFSQILPKSFLGTHPLLFLRALQICLWRHPSHLPPPYDVYRDEDWQDNDGALNTVSQLYPRIPIEHPHCEIGTESTNDEVLQPGIWYYTTLQADHIYFIVNRDRAGVHFDLLYDGIFQRCHTQMRRVLKSQPVEAVKSLCNL
ncbi:unnamed protein product [Sphagnum troendelagicum]